MCLQVLTAAGSGSAPAPKGRGRLVDAELLKTRCPRFFFLGKKLAPWHSLSANSAKSATAESATVRNPLARTARHPCLLPRVLPRAMHSLEHGLLLALVAAQATGSAGARGGTLAFYDAAGVHPQCSQGPAAYMTECVLSTDYFGYVLAADPVQTSTAGCADLGYTYVARDPVFNFDLYWKGGPAAVAAFEKAFAPGHPEVQTFLGAAMAKNPACNATAAVAVAVAVADAKRRPKATATPSAGAAGMITAYDHAGALPQCSEGPADYMTDCVQQCDFVAYLKSERPTRVPGASCAEMGYQGMDNIYPKVKLYVSPDPRFSSSSSSSSSSPPSSTFSHFPIHISPPPLLACHQRARAAIIGCTVHSRAEQLRT